MADGADRDANDRPRKMRPAFNILRLLTTPDKQKEAAKKSECEANKTGYC